MAATTHKSHDGEEKSHHSFLRALGERAPSREAEGKATSPISTIEAAECGTSLERHGICGRRGGCRCRSQGLASSTSAAPTSSTTLGSIRSGACWWFLDAFEVTSRGIPVGSSDFDLFLSWSYPWSSKVLCGSVSPSFGGLVMIFLGFLRELVGIQWGIFVCYFLDRTRGRWVAFFVYCFLGDLSRNWTGQWGALICYFRGFFKVSMIWGSRRIIDLGLMTTRECWDVLGIFFSFGFCFILLERFK